MSKYKTFSSGVAQLVRTLSYSNRIVVVNPVTCWATPGLICCVLAKDVLTFYQLFVLVCETL